MKKPLHSGLILINTLIVLLLSFFVLKETAYAFSGSGAGTDVDPYQISSCAQLQEMKNSLAASYSLSSDIDCSGYSGFVPVAAFTGKLNGNSHNISNLTITSTANYIGLFGNTSYATVSYVNLANINYSISGSGEWVAGFVGGLIGTMGAGTVDHCSVSGVINQIYSGTSDYVGGLIGHTTDSAQITNSSSSVNITMLSSSLHVGGFVGVADGATLIEDSFATGSVSGGYHSIDFGGFLGYQKGSTKVNRCYSTGVVTVGVGLNDSVAGVAQSIGGFAGIVGGDAAQPHDLEINDSYSTSDVLLYGKGNTLVGGFAGVLYDGASVNRSHSAGEITNTASGATSVGGFAGGTGTLHTSDYPEINNSYSSNVVTVGHDSYMIGGFIGNINHGYITHSHCIGDINYGTSDYENGGGHYIGGFVGEIANASTITNSYTTSNVSTIGSEVQVIGGFAGYMQGTAAINQCSSSNNSVSGAITIGGFAGFFYPNTSINNSYSKTNVLHRNFDYSIGDLNGQNAYIGGFGGRSEGNETNNYSASPITFALTNPITAGSISTGLSSDIDSTVTSFNVTSSAGIVPGVYLRLPVPERGYFDSTTTAYVTAGDTVVSVEDASGFQSGDSVELASTSMSEWVDIDYIDGNTLYLVGSTPATSDYETGSWVTYYGSTVMPEVVLVKAVNGNNLTVVRGMANTEAVAHYSGANLTDIFPSVTPAKSGGYSGYSSSGTKVNNYWDTDVSNYLTSFVGNGLITSQMKDQANYSAWDFTNIWGINSNINDGYPYLRVNYNDESEGSVTPTPSPTPSVNPGYNLVVPATMTARLENNWNWDLGVVKIFDNTANVRLTKNDIGHTPLASVNVTFNADHDWSQVSASSLTGDSDPVTGKSFVHNLIAQEGAASSFSLYIPIKSGFSSSSVIICPGATSFEAVTENCTNSQTKTLSSEGVSQVDYNGTTYWKVDGLTGTGGLAINDSFTVKDTMTRLKAGAPSDHTITFGTVSGLTGSGNSIDVSMPDWNLSGLTVSDFKLSGGGEDFTLAGSAGQSTWGLSISSGKITLTAPLSSGYISAGSTITLMIGNIAGGVNQPVNPIVVNNYPIIITNHTSQGVETGETTIPIVDSDTVNVTGFVNTFINFDIDTAVTDTDCAYNECLNHGSGTSAANYVVDLGELNSTWVNKSNDTSVTHSDNKSGVVNSIWFDLTSNAYSGVIVYVRSANGGLHGPATNLIQSVSDGNNILANDGAYGFQLTQAGTGNGTINRNTNCTSQTAYCGLPAANKEVFNTNGMPLDGGRLRMDLAAAASYTNNPGSYTDTLTFAATATF